MYKKALPRWFIATLAVLLLLSACQSAPSTTGGKKTIVVTYSILGSVVKDLVGEAANVIVSMPNGQDPHEWEPSAKDIEILTKADLIVQNGLGLEGGMQKALAQAKDAGVKFFTASDHITVRHVGPGEGLPTGDPDQAVGAEDPHLWTDPVDMQAIVTALAAQIKTDLGIDLSSRATDLEARLASLHQEVLAKVNSLPQANRKLVTGHESMGYFAQRYGFKLVGAIIPSLSTQSEVSASDLAALKQQIEDNQVKAIFTELGTPKAVSDAIGAETGVKVIELTTHSMPPDDSYFTFERNLADTIVNGLQ
ncbi:MAG TPA: metal ABC transporter substrate-binding protein [Anaerolineaceae bacterium]|nr:metal ABC transporter substrate-binding protein [Anaerolineaceae bacterium]